MSKRDSDPIMISGKCPDDLTSVIMDIASNVQYKLFMLIFLMFIILSTDVFVNRILSKFKGATEVKVIQSWGVMIQGLFLLISMITLDAAIKNKII